MQGRLWYVLQWRAVNQWSLSVLRCEKVSAASESQCYSGIVHPTQTIRSFQFSPTARADGFVHLTRFLGDFLLILVYTHPHHVGSFAQPLQIHICSGVHTASLWHVNGSYLTIYDLKDTVFEAYAETVTRFFKWSGLLQNFSLWCISILKNISLSQSDQTLVNITKGRNFK